MELEQLMQLDRARERYRQLLARLVLIKETLTACAKDSAQELLKPFRSLHANMLIDGRPLVPEPVVSGLSRELEDRLTYLEEKETNTSLTPTETQELQQLHREERNAPHCPTGLISCIGALTAALAVPSGVAVIAGFSGLLDNVIRPHAIRFFPEFENAASQGEDKEYHLTPNASILLPERNVSFARLWRRWREIEQWLQTNFTRSDGQPITGTALFDEDLKTYCIRSTSTELQVRADNGTCYPMLKVTQLVQQP
jgi:hypothetical protein